MLKWRRKTEQPAVCDFPEQSHNVPAVPPVTLVYEYDRSDLHDHRMAAPAGSTVRINVGFLGEHVSYSEQQAAASLASSAAAVEIVGSGPGARWLAEAVARQLAEWRDHNAL